MENQLGIRTDGFAELREIQALIDENIGNLRRQLRLVDEETDEVKRLEIRKRISKGQDEFMEHMKYIQSGLQESEKADESR